MRKLINNQRGDAALYILSFALVIAVIGYAGWRVWKSMEDPGQGAASSISQLFSGAKD